MKLLLELNSLCLQVFVRIKIMRPFFKINTISYIIQQGPPLTFSQFTLVNAMRLCKMKIRYSKIG